MQELLLIGLLLMQAPAAGRPSGSISGRIVFSDGTPAAGLFMQAAPVPGPVQPSAPPRGFSYTDASGTYRLLNVAAGRYYVRVGRPGEANTYYPGVAADSDATIVTVANEAIDNLNFALPVSASGVRVLGHVTLPANQPAAAANQRVQIGGGPIFPLESPIAADGTFEIPHVLRGNHAITVTNAPGMQSRPLLVGDTDLRGVELPVPRLVPVSGTVTTDNGSARPRFTIAVDGLAYRTNVAAGPEGNFRVALPEGQYRLGLALTGGYYLKSLESGKTDLQKDLLTINPADAAVSVKVGLGVSSGVRVRGLVTVIGPNALSTSMKTLTLNGRAVTELAETPIAPDGSFDLSKVMPGSYLARVTLASNLSPPVVPVVIPIKDVRDLDIEIPAEMEVRGRVAVDGYGPPPRFSLILINGEAGLAAGKAGELPSLSDTSAFAVRAGTGGAEIVQMSVNALPDGSFKMKLPEGTYRVAASPGPNALPQPYLLRTMTYGDADLLKEPMKLSSEGSPELQIGFGTATPNPWVAVNGRVRGFDPVNGPLRVSLESRITSGIEAVVGQNGAFEFPRVLQRNNYTARLLPPNDAASSPSVTVADRDVAGVEIMVPEDKEVRIVTAVEDGGPPPSFVISFAGSGSTVSSIVKPERDGSFRAKLPMDERRVTVTGFPLGYKLKSAAYGTADVLKEPLKISKDDAEDLKVAFGPDPTLPLGNLRGRISGVDPQRTGVQLVLNGVTSFSTFETAVGPDGSFAFSKIPQGAYVPALTGAGLSGMLSPSSVIVSGSDVFSVELAAAESTPFESPVSGEPTGVVVSSLLASRQAANESSAVANLRSINTAQVAYLSTHGGNYGSIPDLINAGLLDARFGSNISNFNFSIIAGGSNYAAAAIPATQSGGRYGYFSTTDAVIRWSTLDVLAPARQNGIPVQ